METAAKRRTQRSPTKKRTYNKDFSTNQSLGDKQPNIILIMNESLADYSLIGKVNYNRDPLAFIHSLDENTIYGRDYVSIFGAGTSNSEFEAMTGNTIKFFPSGSNVYQQFMHESTFALPGYLKNLVIAVKQFIQAAVLTGTVRLLIRVWALISF